MIHLPLSHVCPACGGPHRASLDELPAASALRPYFGTYTPSKFPRTDTLTVTSMSYPNLSSGNGNGVNMGSFTVTIPRTGHYHLGCYLDGSFNSIGYGVSVQGTVSGLINENKTTDGFANSGTPHFHCGWSQHADCTVGQTLTFTLWTWWIPNGSASGVLHAHFVPTPTYPQ